MRDFKPQLTPCCRRFIDKARRQAARAAFAVGALLVVGAAPAQAQSVTIYGLLDQAVEYVDKVNGGGSLTRLPSITGTAPSRFGLRGSGDLGGGLKAVFSLEQGLSPDSGVAGQGGRMFGRQAFVGLSSPWGTVSLGRQYTMLYHVLLDADIFGPNLYGTGSLDSYLPNARADNSVAYMGRFGGLSAGFTFSTGRDTVNAGPSPAGTNCPGELSTDKKTCRNVSAMLKYDTQSWGLAAAADEQRGGPGAFAGLVRSNLKDQRITVNGYVKFSAFKLGLGMLRRDNDGNAATPRSDLWFLEGSYAFSPALTLDAMVTTLKYRNSDNEATLVALRAVYALSRRTAVYATAGRIANDGRLALTVSGAQVGSAPAPGDDQTGVAVGIRHAF